VNIYYVWMTVLIPTYQDAIVAGLVKKGYMVGAACRDGQPSFTLPERSPSTLISLSIYKVNGDDKITANDVYTDVAAALKEMNAKYFSVIISQAADAAWYGANFSLPDLATKDEPPKKIDPKMN
jgi:hypothetical protein